MPILPNFDNDNTVTLLDSFRFEHRRQRLRIPDQQDGSAERMARRPLGKRELPKLDEKLFMEVFAQPYTPTTRRAATRR